jgi:hypothetical protein
LPSESDSEKPNVIAETKPLPADIPTTYVLKFKSVFKCRICPRIICLTEDTLRNHLQSKVLRFSVFLWLFNILMHQSLLFVLLYFEKKVINS